MMYEIRMFQSTFEGLGIAGLGNIKFQALGAAILKARSPNLISIAAKIGPDLTQISGLWVE